MSVVINGTGSISGLSNVGGISSPQVGSVLQVVSATSSTAVTINTASTWTTTNFSVSITPTSSTSKILIMLLGGFIDTQAAARQAALTFYRGATPLGDSTRGIVQYYCTSSRMQVGTTFGYYDSPATTSSTTYTLYVRSNNGSGDTVIFDIDPALATLVAMEVAA
jgi:hypothetical protein